MKTSQTMIGRYSWKAALLAGTVGGTAFLILEMLMVPAFSGGDPLRPLQMIAAILMGQGVLPPAPFTIGVVISALVMHFILALTYAFLFAFAVGRMRVWQSLIAGLLGGGIIYVINFHGFTALFPWFSEARGGVTLFNHLIFGVMTAGMYALLIRPHGREGKSRSQAFREREA